MTWLALLALAAGEAERPVVVPPALEPLRARVDKVRPAVEVGCWLTDEPAHQVLNPCVLVADFDRDGKDDLALLVREASGKRRRGVLVVLASGRVLRAGAGVKLGNGGDDFDWMDAWAPWPGDDGGPRGVLVRRLEAAGAVLEVVDRGRRLRWRQWGD